MSTKTSQLKEITFPMPEDMRRWQNMLVAEAVWSVLNDDQKIQIETITANWMQGRFSSWGSMLADIRRIIGWEGK